MKRTLVALLAIAATVVIVASFVGAGTSHTSSDIEATTFIGAFTGALTGAVTGNLTGSAAGALGNFTVVESDTLKPGSGTAFYLRAKDGHDDADLNCADFSGNLTGNVTGDVTGSASKLVVLSGALPDTATATAAGDGHALVSVTGGTLFIWNATTVTYNAGVLTTTKDAN